MIKVSIILVSYNTLNLTINTITSIYEKTKDITCEVIVVDNNSHDGTIDCVRMLFPDVICIENEENFGFGYANNIGAKIAKGEYIFLLNTDTILLNNAVKILADYLDSNAERNNLVAVCGNLYDVNGGPMTSYSRLFPSIALELNTLAFNILHHIKKCNFYFNFTDKPICFKGALSGADSMFVKKHFDEINGFDQDYFLYYEETDLFYRLIKKGFNVASIPQAKIIHLEGGSEQAKDKTLERSFTSKYIYLSKHCRGISSVIYHYIYKLTLLSRIAVFYCTGKHSKFKYWLMLMDAEKKAYLERNK